MANIKCLIREKSFWLKAKIILTFFILFYFLRSIMVRSLYWLERKNFMIGVVLILSLYFIFYTIPNRLPTFCEPYEIKLLEFEKDIPLVTWTTIVYLSLFPLLISAAYFLPKRKYAESVVLVAIILIFHSIFFFFVPTIYPRDIVSNEDGFFSWIQFSVLPFIDEPKNCYPSLHVSLSFLFSFIWLRYRWKVGIIVLIWTIAITISTLTTKQHYFLDIIGGISVAYFFSIVRIFPKTTANPP